MDGDLSMVGDLWALLPIISNDAGSVHVGIQARTAIEGATGFSFRVRELDYDLTAGWRGGTGWSGGRPVSLFAGQLGKERVDAHGEPYVRYVGLGLESDGFRSGRPSAHRVSWSMAGGPVLDDHQIDGDFVLRGAARFSLTPARSGRPALLLDMAADGLSTHGRLEADLTVGPRVSFPVSGDRQASFFINRHVGRNPLGLEEDLWLLGFAYEEGLRGSPGQPEAPEIDGLVAAGGGEGRVAGLFRLRFLSPGLDGRGVFQVECNVLTDAVIDELYYLFHAGLERSWHDGVAGVYFYHRSNHQLAQPNPRITSINVVEAGLETEGWGRVGRRGANLSWGALDGRLRLGYLIDSSFGEQRRWHARGGLRFMLPLGGARPAPYLLLEAEAGDVANELFAIGAALSERWEVQVERREDEQYYGPETTALLLMARLGF